MYIEYKIFEYFDFLFMFLIIKIIKSFTFSFPKNEIQRLQWIKEVRLERRQDDWLPTNASRVCSIHFGDEDIYLSRTGNCMLKKSSVPICTVSTF